MKNWDKDIEEFAKAVNDAWFLEDIDHLIDYYMVPPEHISVARDIIENDDILADLDEIQLEDGITFIPARI